MHNEPTSTNPDFHEPAPTRYFACALAARILAAEFAAGLVILAVAERYADVFERLVDEIRVGCLRRTASQRPETLASRRMHSLALFCRAVMASYDLDRGQVDSLDAMLGAIGVPSPGAAGRGLTTANARSILWEQIRDCPHLLIDGSQYHTLGGSVERDAMAVDRAAPLGAVTVSGEETEWENLPSVPALDVSALDAKAERILSILRGIAEEDPRVEHFLALIAQGESDVGAARRAGVGLDTAKAIRRKVARRLEGRAQRRRRTAGRAHDPEVNLQQYAPEEVQRDRRDRRIFRALAEGFRPSTITHDPDIVEAWREEVDPRYHGVIPGTGSAGNKRNRKHMKWQPWWQEAALGPG